LLGIRKQIIFVITLYRIIDILITAYREYYDIQYYSSNRASSLSKIIQIIVQLFTLLAGIYDSKNGYIQSTIIVPITKIILLTSSKSSKKVKIRMLKIMAFVMSMTSKMK